MGRFYIFQQVMPIRAVREPPLKCPYPKHTAMPKCESNQPGLG